MTQTKLNCRLPRTIQCPHCGGQMNSSGSGKAPGSAAYFCAGCVPMLRIKELWLGQVVRTGNQEFGFVQLHGASGLGGVHFRTADFVAANGGSPKTAGPHVGDHVLVLLDDQPNHARRVWRVTPLGAAPQNGKPVPTASGNGALKPNEQGRRRGSITTLVTSDWGFITEFGSGRTVFVHRRDLRHGARMVLGQQVTYLPAQTPKGLRACEVDQG